MAGSEGYCTVACTQPTDPALPLDDGWWLVEISKDVGDMWRYWAFCKFIEPQVRSVLRGYPSAPEQHPAQVSELIQEVARSTEALVDEEGVIPPECEVNEALNRARQVKVLVG